MKLYNEARYEFKSLSDEMLSEKWMSEYESG